MQNQLVYSLSEKEIEESGYSLIQQSMQKCSIQGKEVGSYWSGHVVVPLLYTSFNNTILLFDRFQSNRIKHYQVDGGVLLKELVLDGFRIDEIFMFSDRHVGIWAFDFVGGGYWLVQWNLETEELIKYRWRADALQKQHSVRLLAFSRSKLLCVILRNCGDEKEIADKNQLSISYVKFPLTSETVGLAHHYQFTEHSLGRYQFPDKFNDHSAVVWRKAHDNSEPDFSTLHIFSLGSQQIKDYKIDHFFVEKSGWYSAEISDLWEPKEGIVYVEFRQFLSYQKMQKSLQAEFVPQQKLRNYMQLSQPITKQKWHQFSWHLTQNKWEALKTGVNQSKNLSYQIQFTNGFRKTNNIAPYIHIIQPLRNSLLFKPRALQFVDISTEQTVAREEIKDQENFYHIENKDKLKYYYPEHDCLTQVSYQIRRNLYDLQFMQISIKTRKIRQFWFPFSFYLVFLLTEFIEDCDDDLLDAVLMLTPLKQTQQTEI